MSVPISDQDVSYQIILAAEQAIKDLGTLTTEATTFDERITLAANAALQFGERWGVSGGAAVSLLKDADVTLNDTLDKSQVFGAVGPQAWKDVGAAVKTAENDMNAFEHGIDFIRVALGTLSAMLVFQVVNTIKQTFTDAITYANDYSKALYQIQVAQDILAKGGVNITQRELLDIATQVEQKYGVFSNVDMVNAVGNAALLTREFGFTKDQVSQIVQIASALALGPGGGGPTNITNQIEQLTRALTSGTAPAALSKLGVDVKGTSEEVKQLEISLYGTTTALTDQQKAAATLQVLYEHMKGPIQDFSSYQETLPGQADKLSAAWKNFLTSVGQSFNMLKTEALPVLNLIVDTFITIVGIANNWYITTVAGLLTIKYAFQAHTTDLKDLSAQYENFRKQLESTMQGISQSADTATQSIDKTTTSLQDLSKLNVDSLANSINGLANRAAQLAENYQNQQSDSLNSYLLNSARAQQDYQISVANTVQEYNNKRHNIEQTYRNNEVDAEAKFQEQMRQLREKYLFDLEDALRNRDARQVLRLMAQYQMQTEAATNQYQIQHAAQQKQYQQELQDAHQQEQQKLQQMAAAEALKQQRMQEDYNIEKAKQDRQYAQQLADLQQSWKDRLLQEAESLGQQYGLNDSQVQTLYGLLLQYYGPNGYFDKLYDYSYQSLLARATALVNAIKSVINAVGGAVTNSVGGQNVSVGSSHPYRASGGIDIVSSPTKTGYGATYGEAGPEAHIFIPLGGGGVSAPAISSIGGGGAGGHATIEVVLSPDLEARITENTLNQSADIVTRVMRSK